MVKPHALFEVVGDGGEPGVAGIHHEPHKVDSAQAVALLILGELMFDNGARYTNFLIIACNEAFASLFAGSAA